MKRSALAVLATFPLLLAAPVAAEPAQHAFSPESFDASEHWAASDNPCGSYSATFHEVRTGGFKLVITKDGVLHANGAVDGHVDITPDDPALPSYSGDYREKAGAVVIGTDAQGNDVTKVSHYRLRVPLVGTDGSTLSLVLAGKVTLNGRGDTVVSRDSLACG